MKQFKIEVPDGYEIDQENSNLAEGVVKFKPVAKSRVPKSINDVDKRNWYINAVGEVNHITDSSDENNFSTRQRAEAMLALGQLIEIYAAIEQCQKDADYFLAVSSVNKDLRIFFWFETNELKDEFYSLHKQLIEIVEKGL